MKYTGKNLKEISFPIGGIGTGSIGLSGNGSLIDWEIFNRPKKGSLNGYSHIAIKAKTSDGRVLAKVLNADIQKDFTGQYSKGRFSGYGFGPSNTNMCGFPHFKNCEFTGEFPIAKIVFFDDSFPARITLTAFNPFIPLDSKNSSIPAAFFEINIENTTDDEIEYTTAFSLMNPFENSKNQVLENDKYTMIQLYNDGKVESDLDYGDLTISCDDKNAMTSAYWYRGGWQDGISSFWREFSSTSDLKKREYTENGKNDMCTIGCKKTVGGGNSDNVRFALSWNIPNNYNYWNRLTDENGRDISWKNYYATIFKSSAETAIYVLTNWEDLYAKTLVFKNALFSATLDSAVIDAVSATLSVLKSPTVLRLEDGSFYGWEGVHEEEGSCEGTCSHVWNYAYSLCFLFPDLERSIRDLEFKYNTYDNGEMCFRLKLPLGRYDNKFRACVDGQMGSVIKIYREWKISGDNQWLAQNWENINKILSYAWNETNCDEWDKNKDGVLEGRQHHTLDMELFGPSSWLQGFYLAALKAGAEMAQHLGYHDKHDEYMGLYEKGYKWTKENLFNGNYFIQMIDLNDKSVIDHFNCQDYWNEETKELKYQIGDGCEIDQMLGQWHSNICGLGDIFDKEQVKTALKNLYENNFKKSMRDFANSWRIFSLNDESGTIICNYPNDSYKPIIPIPYCEETMHGFEYALAGLLISENMICEGLSIVQSVRDRYNGENRNPWNEIECGSNYARSMASFALLPIFSGFEFDLPNHYIAFNPKVNKENFRCLWSLGTGWGEFILLNNTAKITINSGRLLLNKIGIKFANSVKSVKADGKEIAFFFENGIISFDNQKVEQGVEIFIGEK